ncbi:hypothetical protein SUGI_1008730 [Cryptomeria japonica]|uniref:chloride channel protein CLC-c n=1 Tax=Cryptomeria japonica TaxID=3369 RepID=UPI002414BDC2|nr:chloride channel protein CLC-c [Cryptomeria japonica]GLJ47760.1 hypothetical protein SUGI_1008730 [Cryptomeria japonica]
MDERDSEGEKLSEMEIGLKRPLLRKRGAGIGLIPNSSSQMALVGSQVSPLESLDYEVIENDLFKQDWRSKTKVEIFHYIVLKWTLVFLIGLFVGLIAAFINLAVENIAGMKLLIASKLVLQQRYLLAFAIFTAANLLLVLCAAVLTAYVAPTAAGAGVPEIKAYLNGVDLPGFLGPSTLFVKVFGSICATSAGLDLGKEGPLIHTGSCIASLMGQGGSRRYHLTWRWLRFFKNDRDRRDLITCGAAAGVAAAFRAPIGGVLFALEEIATWWRSALLWRTFFTTAVVAVVLRAFIDYCGSGNCGLFGGGGLIMFDVSSVTIKYRPIDLLPVVILGVVGGVVGAVYNYLLEHTLRIYALINQRGPISKILLSCAVSLYTSCCIFGLPWLVACKPCPEGKMLDHECPNVRRTGNFKRFHCPEGHYNDLATLLFNTNDAAVRSIFSSGTGNEFQLTSLLLYFIAIFILGLVTYGLALPSGLFIPLILIGSTYGRALGEMMGSFANIDQGLFAVLGAASLLGGSMRMTVSLCVILLELTNNLSLLPSIMIELLISKTIADCFNSSVYDKIVHLKGLPFLEAHPEPFMSQLTAGDAVIGPLVTLHRIEKVGNVVQILKNTKHNAFPVIDEPPNSETPVLRGLVLRSHLLVLLKKKDFHISEQDAVVSAGLNQNLSSEDFAKPGSGKGLKIEEIEVSAEKEEMYMDLHTVINTSPYTVVETMSLAKALILFRHLGLRHLCVVPKETERAPIVGILTRHDFMPAHILARHPHLQERKTKRLGI